MARERRERILEASYLDDLSSWSTADIRTARAACEEEETAISYARRLLQGQLDILQAELRRRDHAGEPQAGTLLEQLPGILAADHVASDPLHARATSFRVPDDADEIEAELDAAVDRAALADAANRSTEELHELLEQLRAFERQLSGTRRALFDRIDALRDELARRYKDGSAAVSDLFSGS